LLASFVLSRTLVPTLCAKWLGEEHSKGGKSSEEVPSTFGRVYEQIELGLHLLTQRYLRLLGAALRYRALVLASVSVLFLASFGLLLSIGREFFPQVDAGQITLFVRAPSGTNIEATEQRIAEVERFLEAN